MLLASARSAKDTARVRAALMEQRQAGPGRLRVLEPGTLAKVGKRKKNTMLRMFQLDESRWRMFLVVV